MIKIPRHIEELQAYKAGKPVDELMREKKLSKIVKLASNENPFGTSPKAMKAIRKNVQYIHRYTDPSAYKFVHVLSKKYNKKPEQIISSSGSDSLLQYIIIAFSTENDELLTSEGTFAGWYANVNKFGRNSKLISLNDYHIDLTEIANNISPRTKIIYLSNPNNPTGTMFSKSEFEKFMEKIPDDVLVLLDEAYTVYAASNPDYPDGLQYNLENLIVIRTFSKSYGLAGIRIGIGFGPEYLIKELYKVKLPFEPNLLAQEAAIAALNDEEFLIKTKLQNAKSLVMLKHAFEQLNIRYVNTSSNFYLLLFPNKEFARNFHNECLNNCLIIRHLDTFGIPNGIRINSGTDDETEFAIDVMRRVYPKLLEKYNLNVI